jgi:uncharacterized protein
MWPVRAPHRLLCVLAGIALTLTFAIADDRQPVPELHARVTDLTKTLDIAQTQTLTSELEALEKRKGTQIGVLIVPTTQPEDIAQYSIRVFDVWKLGRKGVDDGVLLIVAKDDHRVRIEVARGLEGAIPDAAAARIREYMTPKFRVGNFYDGIHDATDALTKLIDGEPLPPPAPRRYVCLSCFAVFGFFFAFIARLLFEVKATRLAIRAPIMVAGYGFAIWWLTQAAGKPLTYTLVAMAIGTAYAFLVALIRFPDFNSRYSPYSRYSGGGDSSSSSSGSSSSSSSSSDSSFSGGGGESSGGGASGSW